MSIKTKDFLERLGFTVGLAAVSFGIVYLTGKPEAWALAVLALLQITKNLLAQQVGDPVTSGFTNPEPMYVEPQPVDANGIPATSEDDLL